METAEGCRPATDRHRGDIVHSLPDNLAPDLLAVGAPTAVDRAVDLVRVLARLSTCLLIAQIRTNLRLHLPRPIIGMDALADRLR